MARPRCFVPNRIFLVHLLCVFELTFSSFMALLYSFLLHLENLVNIPYDRIRDQYRWWVVNLSIADFAIGSVLSYGINQVDVVFITWEKKNTNRRGKILLWIYLDTLLIPVSLYFLLRLKEKLSEMEHEDLRRIHLDANYAHIGYILLHFALLFLVINCMAYHVDKVKKYDPRIRPTSVYEPTHPSITTTESQHIRFSSSILMMGILPSTSTLPRILPSTSTLPRVLPSTSTQPRIVPTTSRK